MQRYSKSLLVVGLLVIFSCFSWGKVLDALDRKAVMDMAKGKNSMEA